MWAKWDPPKGEENPSGSETHAVLASLEGEGSNWPHTALKT